MNNKDNKEFVMPNGFKITGNINYYTKRKLEGIAAELEEPSKMGSGQKCWPKKVLAMG